MCLMDAVLVRSGSRFEAGPTGKRLASGPPTLIGTFCRSRSLHSTSGLLQSTQMAFNVRAAQTRISPPSRPQLTRSSAPQRRPCRRARQQARCQAPPSGAGSASYPGDDWRPAPSPPPQQQSSGEWSSEKAGIGPSGEEQQGGPLAAARNACLLYDRAVKANPVLTKALTSFAGFAIGDRIAQSVLGTAFDPYRSVGGGGVGWVHSVARPSSHQRNSCPQVPAPLPVRLVVGWTGGPRLVQAAGEAPLAAAAALPGRLFPSWCIGCLFSP